ncbi:MAG: hypothetical protein ABFD89_06670 [Bryobacteraceae bacterium]
MALDPVTSVAGAVDDGIRVILQKDAQLNTPAAVSAKQASEVQTLKEAIKAAIEKGDLDEIRRLCA